MALWAYCKFAGVRGSEGNRTCEGVSGWGWGGSGE